MNNQSFYIESNKFFLISLGSNLKLEDCLKTDVEIGGTYFVVEKKTLLGLFTDRDIRSSNIDLKKKIIESTELWQKEIIYLKDHEIVNTNEDQTINLVKKKCAKLNLNKYPNHIPVINDKNALIKILDFNKLNTYNSQKNKRINSVSVIGMGYVGLTLAITLADKGFQVFGYDISDSIINKLNKCQTHILEPRIEEYLQRLKETKKLEFGLIQNIKQHDAYIICVGTDVVKKNLDDRALKASIKSVSKVYSNASHIFLRSTVPVGTSRNLINYLKKLRSDLSENEINLSFTPERTIEGDAFEEIKNIPQIIGSNNERALEKAEQFWNKISLSSLLCENLEEAELVKLINNSYRDLRFAFANQIGIMCEKYSINAHKLISKANSGYPRDPIAYPSPGVGGYCLTKDPLLLNQSFKKNKSLSQLARDINIDATYAPIRAIKNWVLEKKINFNSLKVLIIGLAFKGSPSTKDTRCSISIDILKKLLELNVSEIFIFDGADADLPKEMEKDNVYNLGSKLLKKTNLSKTRANVILILNNHPDNKLLKLSTFISEANYEVLLFDGWDQVGALNGLNLNNLHYRTIGQTK